MQAGLDAAVTLPGTPYALKPSRSSSHSVMLDCLPEQGAGRSVLDLGCSAGYLAAILAERGYRVTGIDLPGSDRSRFPHGSRFVEADLDEGMPPLDEAFDYILCGDVLEHLKRPERLLAQIRGALAPAGTLVASLPNSGHLYFRLVVLAGRFPAHDRGLFDRTHLRFYTWDGWCDLFRSAGFNFTHVRTTSPPVEFALPGWPRTLVSVLDRCLFTLARLWRRMFAYQFIVTARPRERRNSR